MTWEVVEHTAINNVKGYRIFDGDNEIAVCRNTAGGLGAVIALPTESNARLISAAPDLLKACRAFLELDEIHIKELKRSEWGRACLEQANIAVEKAVDEWRKL